MWLWAEKTYISFDEGSRIEAFTAFQDHAQFEIEATRLAKRAASEVQHYRGLFPSVDRVCEFYLERPPNNPGLWQSFHAGVACAMSGKPSEAVRFFDQFLQSKNDRPEWLIAAQTDAEQLRAIATDTLEFRQMVAKRVQHTRELQKLPDAREINFDDVLQTDT
jgi:hypothetical protein